MPLCFDDFSLSNGVVIQHESTIFLIPRSGCFFIFDFVSGRCSRVAWLCCYVVIHIASWSKCAQADLPGGA